MRTGSIGEVVGPRWQILEVFFIFTDHPCVRAPTEPIQPRPNRFKTLQLLSLGLAA